MIFIIFGWAFIALIIGWGFIALSWWLIVILWDKNIFMPYAVETTTKAFMFIILGVPLIFFACFIWTRYKLYRYNSNCKDKTEPLNIHASHWSWAEMVCNNDMETIMRKPKKKLLSPYEALSYAIILAREKNTIEAVSLLRLIIRNPSASMRTKEIAESKLVELLPNTGHIGLSISKKIIKGEKYNG